MPINGLPGLLILSSRIIAVRATLNLGAVKK